MHTPQARHADALSRNRADALSHDQRTSTHGCLPLVVGVTGHRDYDTQYTEQLKAAISGILQGILKEYGNTEIILLSPLAPGADRLAAAVALDLGISLYVPLPFPHNDLPPGFVQSEEHADFETLCRAAKHLFFAGQPLTTPRPPASPTHPGKKSESETEAHYAAAGAFVAAHCHILIALWDGNGNSQTARTLGYKRTGLPQEFAPGRSLLDPVDGGLWHHVYTPRKETAPPGGVPPPIPGEIQDRRPSETSDKKKIGPAMYRHIDEYNGYVKKLLGRADAPAKLTASRNALFQDEDKIALSPALKRLRDAFAAADVLAMELKVKAHRNFSILAFLVVAATAIFLVQAHFPLFKIQEKPGLLLVAALLLISVRILLQAWRRTHYRYQDKFQDYRALAEGLRVQFYWTLLGLPDSVADHYLRKQRLELEWVRHVFSTWDIYKGGGEDARHGMTAAQRRLRISVVQARWVQAQQSFFREKRRRDASGSHRTEVSEKTLLNLYIGLMIFCGLLLLLAQSFPPHSLSHPHSLVGRLLLDEMSEVKRYECLHGFCILVIEVPLIIAAVVHLWAEKFALTAQAKQYERMDRLFTQAKAYLERFVQGVSGDGLDSDAEVDELLRSLGREALAENADWVLMHRERLLEITSLS